MKINSAEPTIDLAILQEWSDEELTDFGRYAYAAYGNCRGWTPQPRWEALSEQMRDAWACAAEAAIRAHERNQAAGRVIEACAEGG